MIQLSLPTLFTLLRIALAPCLVVALCMPDGRGWPAAAIFLLAIATDWLDGYLARRLKLETAFGAFLDPVADKILVATALVLLSAIMHSLWFAVPAAIIVGREIAVSALREWMASGKQRPSVLRIAKYKTIFQYIAITLFLLLSDDKATGAMDAMDQMELQMVAYAMLYTAAGLTLYSMARYLVAAWRQRQRA